VYVPRQDKDDATSAQPTEPVPDGGKIILGL